MPPLTTSPQRNDDPLVSPADTQNAPRYASAARLDLGTVVGAVGQLQPAIPSLKTGFRTSEFWLAFLFIVITLADKFGGVLPATWADAVSGVVILGYSALRWLIKRDHTAAALEHAIETAGGTPLINETPAPATIPAPAQSNTPAAKAAGAVLIIGFGLLAALVISSLTGCGSTIAANGYRRTDGEYGGGVSVTLPLPAPASHGLAK